MSTAPDSRSGRARSRRTSRLLALAVAATVLVPATPVLARAGAPAPADLPSRHMGGLPAPSAQVPANDPGFVDDPLPTNPISPAVADVVVESAELDVAGGALTRAEGRRDDAIAERDRLRRLIEDLAARRVEAVELLGRRQADEAQRGLEREAAVAALEERRADLARAERVVDRAEAALERAHDALRQLIIANYMSEASTISDIGTVLSGQGGVNDALVRLSLGESSLAARSRDIEDRLEELAAAERARDRADEARARAERALGRAEEAERAAIEARRGTEADIRNLDAEAEQAVRDEVAAGEDITRREADVLIALADVAPARLRADVVGAGIDFPLVALDAWLKAAAGADCRVEWWMLAGVSKVEGNHGTFGGGRLGARGYPTTRIIGPPLDGTNGNALIRDTDGGLYDDDPVLDRAVGPMQFIPSTWARWGRDGDGDGVADPHTFYDATASAAAYLCAGRTDLTDEAQLRAAYLSYNRSLPYVEKVLREARAYQAALLVPPHPPEAPPTGLPPLPGP